MQQEQTKKGGFTSSIGFVLAAAGSAVGLGNLWAFPYKAAENGGAAFVFLYVACVLFIGAITMICEMKLLAELKTDTTGSAITKTEIVKIIQRMN